MSDANMNGFYTSIAENKEFRMMPRNLNKMQGLLPTNSLFTGTDRSIHCNRVEVKIVPFHYIENMQGLLPLHTCTSANGSIESDSVKLHLDAGHHSERR